MPPKKIFIVDDSAFMRTTVKGILTGAGYEVVGESETGEEALEKYQELRPDLVTMDVIMLGEGGVRAVKGIVAHHPEAKILMVSAMGQQGLIVESIQAGAKGFIAKPVDPETLVKEVRRIIGE